MKYRVEVEYTMKGVLTVHAARPDLARLRAESVVKNEWRGVVEAKAVSVQEAVNG